ncbi:hypothetical protein [Pseudomonas fluorescens]|uniref:hypothetical protein n=1 Tax=Pseudomonas fluorescens TaxID=294 RepID=UPI00148636C4|nr:hypothetical protein [Pseudomonas fluorescens]
MSADESSGGATKRHGAGFAGARHDGVASFLHESFCMKTGVQKPSRPTRIIRSHSS